MTLPKVNSQEKMLKEKLGRRFERLQNARIDTFHDAVREFFLFYDGIPSLVARSYDRNKKFPAATSRVRSFVNSPDITLNANSEEEAACFGEAALRLLLDYDMTPRALYDQAYYRKAMHREPIPQAEHDARSLTTFKDRFLHAFEIDLLEGLETIVEDSSIEDLDVLLPIGSRRSFDETIQRLFNEATFHGQPLSLLFADIDKFKAVNDEHRHQIGDEVLISVASSIKKTVGSRGMVFRYGGEELCVLLPNHTLIEAGCLAERIRTAISAARHSSKRLSITASFGVSTVDKDGSAAQLIKEADEAVYDAKRLGRDLVRFFSEVGSTVEQPNEPLSSVSTVPRKLPGPQEPFDTDAAQGIRRNYFQSHVARCPIDSAIMDVYPMDSDEEAGISILVLCPMCGRKQLLNPDS